MGSVNRRVISVASLIVAVVALGLVLYNATLVDRRAPGIARVALSAPANGDPAVGLTVTAVDVQFSEPVVAGSVERRFRIEPYVAGTISWDGATTAIFTPAEKLPADTEFTVSIAPGFEDLAGNAADQGLVAWTFRTLGPPSVATADPPDGAVGVPVSAALRLTFDRLMDTTAVERALSIDPPIAVRPSWSGRELDLAFDAPLQFGTTYTVTIATEATDTGGSHLRTSFATRFTTVAAGLRTDAVVPANGVAGIAIWSPIAVVFDAAIDPASVADALRITPSVGGDVSVVALPSDATARADQSASPSPGTVLLYVPSSPLAAHTTYTVELDPVVRRVDGAEVAAGRTWSFTTGGPTPSAQNQVAFLSARSGVRNVWLMNPDGSNPRQLTTELVPVTGFDASADGARIAWSAGGLVHVMQIDGTAGRVLTPNDRFEYAPRFSPDGRTLLVGRRAGDGTDEGYWLVPLPDVLDVPERQVLGSGAPPLGSVRLLGEGIGTGDGTPVWAGRAAFDPQGRHLLVTTATGDVRLIDLQPDATGAAPVVTDTGLSATAAGAWSAFDETFLIAARRPGDPTSALWAVPPDGPPVAGGPAAGSVAVTQDGQVVFLSADGAGATHVAVRRAADTGTQPRLLTAGSELDDRWPAFTPDGRSVIFGRVPRQGAARSAGIWIVDVASGRSEALSTDGAYPRWLP